MDLFEAVSSRKWDRGIFFPPCTHLAVSGTRSFEKKKADGRQQQGIDFFMKVVAIDIPETAIENPIGIMSTIYRKPDQIINPNYFGDPARKSTCLWLKNLPKLFWAKEDDLFATKTWVEPELVSVISKKGVKKTFSKWEYEASCNKKERANIRSKTFPGIAQAMADQWG